MSINMSKKLDLKNLGFLISKYRVSKGLTQKEFAKYLNTSQSAVARIEKGEQNLTTLMLRKISQILGKNLISLSEPSLNLHISGGRVLSGSLSVRSSRISSVSLAYASLLNSGTTLIKNIAMFPEMDRILLFFKSLGIKYTLKSNGDILVVGSDIPSVINKQYLSISKEDFPISSLLILGSLFKKITNIELPIQERLYAINPSLKVHLNALEQLGARFSFKGNILSADFKNVFPGEVFIAEFSNTATINTILAASQLSGTTIIKKSSMDFPVVDVCLYLKKLGVSISGVGTPTIVVQGNSYYKKIVEYSPIPDVSESLFYLSSGLITKSSITIKNIPLDFLEPELNLIKGMGANIEVKVMSKKPYKLGDITTKKSSLRNITNVFYPQIFPGIRYDSLPYLVALFSIAEGRILVHDWMSDERSYGFMALKKLGIDVFVADLHHFFIPSSKNLMPATINCSPALHPGDVFLLLMLGIKGESRLLSSYSVSKWHYDLITNLNSIGAKIDFIYDEK